MIFEHFAQRAGDGERRDGVGDEHSHQTGLAQAGTGRGLGFARRLRAVLAEADAKPADDTVSGPEVDREEENDSEEAAEQRSAPTSPALSHTRSHRKRPSGAYGDQTRTGYVNTFSSVRWSSSFALNPQTKSCLALTILFCCARYDPIRECCAARCLVPRATSWAARLHGFLTVVGIQ